jgi:hypothetical protein
MINWLVSRIKMVNIELNSKFSLVEFAKLLEYIPEQHSWMHCNLAIKSGSLQT